MFRGIHELNLDAKGRMAVPTRYRDTVRDVSGSTMIATIDTEDRCLLLYTVAEWEPIEKIIAALPSFNKKAKRIKRLALGHASELEMDGSGRLSIPQILRDYAGLEKKIVLVGQANKFEIWNQNNWNASREIWLKEAQEESDEGLPEELQSLSF